MTFVTIRRNFGERRLVWLVGIAANRMRPRVTTRGREESGDPQRRQGSRSPGWPQVARSSASSGSPQRSVPTRERNRGISTTRLDSTGVQHDRSHPGTDTSLDGFLIHGAGYRDSEVSVHDIKEPIHFIQLDWFETTEAIG